MTKTVLENSNEYEVFAEGTAPALAPGEIVLGYLKGIDSNGNPLVIYPQLPSANPAGAVSTVPVTQQHIGRQVALLFAYGDYHQPVIMGFIYCPLDDLLENFSFTKVEAVSSTNASAYATDPVERSSKTDLETVRVDGERVVIEGKEEIVLKCGEASITLTNTGKILIRGKYLLSRSSGVNRILGGSVQVN